MMDFAFLHPEFFWILPPVSLLFFFWLTQKSYEYHWLDGPIAEKLRVQEHTLSLRARNILFFAAALLMVVAMAQPVLYDSSAHGSRLKILLVLDLHPNRIEGSKRFSLAVLKKLDNDDVALVSNSSLIATPTRQYRFLESMILNLPQELRTSISNDELKNFAKRYHFDKVIIPTYAVLMRPSESVLRKEAEKIAEEIQEQKHQHAYRFHTPLFFYPLGLAMLLILLALASKSVRKSVSVEFFMLFLLVGNVPSEAALMDFKLLKEANQAYVQGNYSMSLKKFQTYQKSHDSPQIRYNIANTYYQMGAYEQAIRWYEKVRTDDEVLMRYRDENMQSAFRLIEEKKMQKQTRQKSYTAGPIENSSAVLKNEKMPVRIYPLKIFRD